MPLTPKIFVSVPNDYWLPTEQRDFKRGILQKLRASGFEPIVLGEFGDQRVWTLQGVSELLAVCQGMVIIGSLRVDGITLEGNHRQEYLLTEWSHMEGVMALERRLPLLLLIEEGAAARGLLDASLALRRLVYPRKADANYLLHQDFIDAYDGWAALVNKRYDVFFGFCGKAKAPANKIKNYLTRSLQVKVLSWTEGSSPGRSIYEQIESWSQQTMGGIFLFSKDDELTPGGQFAPRDNVVLEAGLFAGIKGKARTMIILEEGAKLPSDLSNDVYAKLTSRIDITSIKDDLRRFITRNFG
jgi:hypothetical protein